MGEVGFGGNIVKDGKSVEFKTGSWKNRYPVHSKEKCKNCKKNYIHQKYVNTVAVCNPNIEILSMTP